MIVHEMTRLECAAVLSASRLGRLGCAKGGQPYVVPIHFAFADHLIYSFSMPGQKVDWMRENPLVCIEVNEPGNNREWRSVVINGLFEELTDTPQWQHGREHAWFLLSRHVDWWEPGALKPTDPMPTAQPIADKSPHLFYRIRIETMTGRRCVEEHLPTLPT